MRCSFNSNKMFKLSEFLHFLHHPHFNPLKRVKTNMLTTSIRVYLVLLCMIILANVIKTLISKLFFTVPVNEVTNFFESLKDHHWRLFILVAILAPIAEEMIFRLSLVFNPAYFAISFSLLITLIIHKLTSFLPALISLVLLYFIFYYIAVHYKILIHRFWYKNLGVLVYFSSLSFGLLHVGNYQFVEGYQYLIIPLLIFPQLAMGFLLSFVRLCYQNGILICILVHIIMNAMTVSHFI